MPATHHRLITGFMLTECFDRLFDKLGSSPVHSHKHTDAHTYRRAHRNTHIDTRAHACTHAHLDKRTHMDTQTIPIPKVNSAASHTQQHTHTSMHIYENKRMSHTPSAHSPCGEPTPLNGHPVVVSILRRMHAQQSCSEGRADFPPAQAADEGSESGCVCVRGCECVCRLACGCVGFLVCVCSSFCFTVDLLFIYTGRCSQRYLYMQ